MWSLIWNYLNCYIIKRRIINKYSSVNDYDYRNWLGRNAAKIREELSVDKIVKQWMEIIND